MREVPCRVRRGLCLAALATLGVCSAACGSTDDEVASPSVDSADGLPLVVVTYSVLGDVVRQLVGDAATVEVVIPNGQDPHDYAASAHDVERMSDAAMVIANGLDLEEGLVESIDQIEHEGVPVFRASEHITVRHIGGEESADEDAHDHDGDDPHLWTDPLTMAELAPALGQQLGAALGVDLTERVTEVERAMTDLDAEVRNVLSAVPDNRCVLVTGHESLGYFAERYGCRVVGAVVPSLSSTAEASAKDLAQLIEIAEAEDADAIFTEVGTPTQVAEQIADEIGVPLVELPSHNLPDDGGYQAFIIDLATKITDGLATSG